ncbi:aminoacyl-tRNA hydrolase [Corynebacterium kalidii]|uniref:Peptidyl-tRNA hydrolase n=1 Tax=Corynebacterium kalidii TaxID=2931982 RepID=A0A9X1WH80_9CORY|nr:aminoacyl-tRNA hydrolase [Corynebacterium kalidii]MCJ7858128.1 aminoacyl-tRNA hydrolase [Corynebacterium kalidii]
MSLLARLTALVRRPSSPGTDGGTDGAETPARWLVIGLGNPGGRYEGTRHNVGYLVTDRLVERSSADGLRGLPGTKATVARVDIDGEAVLLVRSTTFMNLSGEAVAPLAARHGISPDHVVVVHDELDLPAGRVKVKLGGNENGHNGLKSVSAELGTRDYVRVRVGIGRPPAGTGVVEYVLTALDDGTDWDATAGTAADAVDIIVTRGLPAAQHEIHSRS